MPFKRKRVDDDDSNHSITISEGRPKRRRNDTTLVDTIQYIFDALRNEKKEDDSYMCEAFLRIPRKKNEPQYYEVIKNPIDMLKIQQKIKTDVYNELDEFCADVQLLVDNAKLYYAKSTDEYKDACDLFEVFQSAKDRSGEELEKVRQQQQQDDDEGYGRRKRGRLTKAALASSAPMILEEDAEPMSIEDAIEELFGAIITAMDQDGRLYSYDFQFLPAREAYPDYYSVIKNPIDLKTISLRLQNGYYNSLESIEKDISLMCENAFTYNEPGSRIYRDARSISRLVELRKQDLVQILSCKDGVRLRCKKAPGDKKWSELLANLQPGEMLPLPEEEQEDVNVSTTANNEDDDSDDDYESANPLWQLFMAAKSLVSPAEPDYPLIEPFRRLPSRRWHSDYYQEIKNPISLTQIRKKFKKMEYITLSDMVDDFNLMLDNAQQYNRPDSKIHRDAAKLQKFIKNKALELSSTPMDEIKDTESDTDDDDSSFGGRRKSSSKPWTFKRRAKILFKTLMDYMTDDGRQPIVAFIEKPSKKDYPDYYEVITHPIDMETIETKIKSDQYQNEDELIADFRLMFSNCQAYNEETSVIHQDANILLKVLNDKIRELQLGGESSVKPKVTKKSKYAAFLNTSKNSRLLFSTIREYRDNGGRQLSDVFLKLPSKSLYPDYYEVIKQPIDLERILQKWKNNSYISIEDMLADLTLVFQNACRYNEPESQIYRDALTLQRLMLQKRLELCSKEETIPNIMNYVQELLLCIFISVFNHEDHTGRYTAESLAELPEYEEIDGQRSRALTFDMMKKRLDKGLYTRLDMFQDDFLSIFNRARKLSMNNARIYQDTVTLEKEYIKVRDELTRHGATLESQALNFKLADFEVILNQEGVLGTLKDESTMEVDINDDTNDTMNESMQSEDLKVTQPSTSPEEGVNNSAKHNEVQYYVGDFVYLNPPEKNVECPIVHVQRLWTNASGQQMLYGSLYYRPAETFHVPNRKFYEQEIFKTERQSGYPLSEVVGKCIALPVSDYPKYSVEGFHEKDVYVCESRYSTKNRLFKKIKAWPFTLPEHIKLIERSQPIEMKKVESVFKERIEKNKEDYDDDDMKPVKKALPNIVKVNETDAKGSIYFYQYNIASGALILGDFVYIRSPTGRAIRHVTRIWVTQEGNSFVTGLKYIRAQDITVNGDRAPYPTEVYLTTVQESFPLSDIIGKCCVLHVKEYLTLRHTEISEQDVYVCERYYDEVNLRVCNLQSGILKFNQIPEITTDEIYHFWKPIPLSKNSSAMLQRNLKMEDAEDSLDGPPNSVTSADSSIAATPRSNKKINMNRKTGIVSGYNMFSSDVRKRVIVQNPDANFGEISRLVGIEWKRLTETDRKSFEDRAHLINQENAEKNAISDPCTPILASVKGPAELPLPNNPDVVFECMWESCDYMFEDLADLYDHLLAENTGHVHKVTGVFECAFRGCSRHKKNSLAPFPVLQRLMRHIREVHIAKNTGRIIQHHDRSRNFMPSTRRSLLTDLKSSAPVSPVTTTSSYIMPGMNSSKDNQYQITIGTPIEVNGQGKGSDAQKPSDPIFVAPPQKSQRLLHSEAYIKYIENLDKPYVANWERQLNANVENTVINETNRLPNQWISNGAGNHGSVINALWALRDYMMKDSLGISKVL